MITLGIANDTKENSANLPAGFDIVGRTGSTFSMISTNYFFKNAIVETGCFQSPRNTSHEDAPEMWITVGHKWGIWGMASSS